MLWKGGAYRSSCWRWLGQNPSLQTSYLVKTTGWDTCPSTEDTGKMNSTVMGKQRLQSNKESGNTLYNSDVAWGEEMIQDSSWDKSGRARRFRYARRNKSFVEKRVREGDK